MGWPVHIVESADAADIAAVQELWSEYWRSLGFSFDFQDFAAELRALPGKGAPPAGRLLLVRIDGQPAGTAAFRPLRQDACEAKRLYVRPAYRELYGDTLATMAPARDLYRGLGFAETGPHSDDSSPGAIYLRLRL